MRSVPLNAASNGRELSRQCLIFALRQSEYCQLTARISKFVPNRSGQIFAYLARYVTADLLPHSLALDSPSLRFTDIPTRPSSHPFALHRKHQVSAMHYPSLL